MHLRLTNANVKLTPRIATKGRSLKGKKSTARTAVANQTIVAHWIRSSRLQCAITDSADHCNPLHSKFGKNEFSATTALGDPKGVGIKEKALH